ncbi:hypothetical protein SFC42_17335 [Priestia filamentosa]|uniref:hypothetical protein n=1 Tax=Priestia filamentosa TaxID=1402861 RepID=UPI003983BF3A
MDKLTMLVQRKDQQIEIVITYQDGKPEHFIINGTTLSRFDLLALASNADDKKFSWELMKLASKLFHWQDDYTFNTLYGSVATELTFFQKEDEFSIHPKFNQQVKKLFGKEAQIIKRKNDHKHQPDSWVRLNGNDIPVEIKKSKFNQKALNQLLRYVDFYETSLGIAVGSEATVDLPDNIIFISTNQLNG